MFFSVVRKVPAHYYRQYFHAITQLIGSMSISDCLYRLLLYRKRPNPALWDDDFLTRRQP